MTNEKCQMTNGRCSGIIAIMRIFLAIIFFSVTISVACTASRSAGSQPDAITNAQPQTPASTTNASQQEKQTCQLTLAGAPDIRGLKVRMAAEEVLALFPGSKEDAEVKASLSRPPSQFGQSEFRIIPDKFASKEKFAGIKHITLRLLDGRVFNLRVGYEGPEYPHVDKFIAKLTEGTNLPAADQWEPYVGMDNNLKILKCVDFEIRVFTGGPGGNLNYVEMKDLQAEKKLKDRKDKAKAKATPTP